MVNFMYILTQFLNFFKNIYITHLRNLFLISSCTHLSPIPNRREKNLLGPRLKVCPIQDSLRGLPLPFLGSRSLDKWCTKVWKLWLLAYNLLMATPVSFLSLLYPAPGELQEGSPECPGSQPGRKEERQAFSSQPWPLLSNSNFPVFSYSLKHIWTLLGTNVFSVESIE